MYFVLIENRGNQLPCYRFQLSFIVHSELHDRLY